MKQRVQFVLEWERRKEQTPRGFGLGMAELCRQFGVSRQTGYKWVARYLEGGRDVAVLATRSTRPLTSPRAIPAPIEDLIVALRKKHPTWGPRKLRVLLVDKHPDKAIPSASGIALVLKRRGFAFPRKLGRRRAPFTGQPLGHAESPNTVWCIDFKGKFRTADGVWCTPFTVTDAYSRFCIRCEVVDEPNGPTVRRILESAFTEFGLPVAIRSDNGPPFASTGPGGLTALAVWLLKLGIRLERIQPGKPDQNGRHERFHRTLEEAKSPPRANARAQQRAFDVFRRIYNEERPHEAIGQRPPAKLHTKSNRRYPTVLRSPSHDPSDHVELVDRNGNIRWRRRNVMISSALAGEPVELLPEAATRWEVHYGSLMLGTIDDLAPGGPRFTPAGRPRKDHHVELSKSRP
jgi:transposase InsO family protein